MIVNGQWYLEEKLERMLREEWLAGDSWYLALFTNDYTPTPAMTPADFVEPAGSWYSRRFLDRALWQAPAWTDPTASSLYGTAAQEWTVTGVTAVVLGYYVLDTLGDRVPWAQRLDDPLTVPAGQVLRVWPRYAETTFCVCATP